MNCGLLNVLSREEKDEFQEKNINRAVPCF